VNKITSISITEARKELLNFPERFKKDKNLKSIIITKRGEPVLDVVPQKII
jgi:antitoxin (DNA-binding transcriptional repressor) of toxin-antitoxin stability system